MMLLSDDWRNFDHILKLKIQVSKVYDVPVVLQKKVLPPLNILTFKYLRHNSSTKHI